MFVRRSATALAGISVAGLAATVLAMPAHANTDVTVTQADDGWDSGRSTAFDRWPSQSDVTEAYASDVTPTPITVAVDGPGEYRNLTLWVRPFASEDTNTTPISGYLYEDEGLSNGCNDSNNCNVISNGTPVTLYVNPDPGGGGQEPLDVFRVGFRMESPQVYVAFGGLYTAFTVTYGAAPTPDPGGGGDDGSGSAAVVSGPGPHIQQFPVPATGTCDEAQPEGLNWGGVSSGGWNESWSWWMHEGEGGHVCTRTLAFNASTAAWEVD